VSNARLAETSAVELELSADVAQLYYGIQTTYQLIDLLNELNQASSLTLFADVQMKPAAAQAHLDMIQALFGKAVTPEDFVKNHQAAIDKGN